MRLLLGIVVALLVFIALIWVGFGSRGVTVVSPSAPGPSVLTSTTQPESRPAPPPATTPAAPSQPALLDTPAYLTIVDVFPNRDTPKLEATISSPTSLQLHTDGIRRIRLEKSQWPHDVAGSIAINIDGQGIEWTRKRAILELVCGKSGGWSVLPENAATSAPVSP